MEGKAILFKGSSSSVGIWGPDRLGQNLSLGKHTHVPYGMQQDAVATMHRRWPMPFVRPGHQLKWSQQIAEKLVRPVVSDWSRTVAERFQPSPGHAKTLI
jgi:hypothetical protein